MTMGTDQATNSRQPSVEPLSSSTSGTSMSLSSQKVKSRLLHAAVGRICAVGISSTAAVQAGGGDKDLWIQLISRLVTRGLVNGDQENEAVRKEKDAIRKQIFEFVTADLRERIELARLWLNEEWYTQTKADADADARPLTDDVRAASSVQKPLFKVAQLSCTVMTVFPVQTQPYAKWLRQLLNYISASSQEKGSSFTQFSVDLPQIPKPELHRLAKMCTDPAG